MGDGVIKNKGLRVGLFLALAVPIALQHGTAAADRPTAGVVLPKDVRVPNDLALGVYLPAYLRRHAAYLPNGIWLRPGVALEGGISAALSGFFPESFSVVRGEEKAFGLLLDIHPVVRGKQQDVEVTLNYRVINASGEVVLDGAAVAENGVGNPYSGSGTRDAAGKAAQHIAVELLTKLKPDAVKYPASMQIKSVDGMRLVDHEKPVSTGTGFYVNAAGQILTAAHVVHDCALIEAKREAAAVPIRLLAESQLVDLAVLDSGTAQEHFLALRAGGHPLLGEPIVNVGYPLQPLLAGSPNLTRGNISSLSALAGALGQIQFSAPIQPGSSGGPIVSDRGELLGIAQATLNGSAGGSPQMVNFALEARYIAMFLKKNSIAFSEIAPAGPADSQRGNDAALAAVLSLACYQ
jgi:serine protease Do